MIYIYHSQICNLTVSVTKNQKLGNLASLSATPKELAPKSYPNMAGHRKAPGSGSIMRDSWIRLIIGVSSTESALDLRRNVKQLTGREFKSYILKKVSI